MAENTDIKQVIKSWLSKLQIEENFLNLTNSIYKNPKINILIDKRLRGFS